ncbi:glycosyltransferase [Brevibacillus ginsengisoli]|uniref:glycosyltransferase n=1 Tax=Brevibacillus ginsengisoli TaxID=363854 RepID=UPI003CF11796
MTKNFLKLTLLVMSLALIFAPLQVQAQGNPGAPKPCISQAEVQLKGDLRRVLTDHLIWTRNYMISAIEGLKDQKQVEARLLKNQEDIGNAIKPYYGEAAGNKLTELFKEHIVIAAKIIDAAKSGNQAEFNKLHKEWHRNADDIAQFLSSANPNWSTNVLKDLLYTHLKLLTDQIVARLKKDYDAEILAFDKGEDHILKLADTLTEGIVKQFPDRFKK